MTHSDQELNPSGQEYRFANQFSKHLEQVYFGGNWTASNLRDQLHDVSFEEAIAKVPGFNTILVLTYHIHYFVAAANGVLERGILDAHDKYSFDHPQIASEVEWKNFVAEVFSEGKKCVRFMREISDDRWHQKFVDQKFGNYLRNLLGTIEHTHYHLGQIAILKKLVREQS